MTGQERKELTDVLNKYNNVGDMIKYLYTVYDCYKPIGAVSKSIVVNGLVNAVNLLNLKKQF